MFQETAANPAVIAIGVGLGMGLAVLGAGIGQGIAAGNAVSGIARQPEATGKIQTAMIIGLALIESLVIFTFVVVNGLSGKIPSYATTPETASLSTENRLALQNEPVQVGEGVEATFGNRD